MTCEGWTAEGPQAAGGRQYLGTEGADFNCFANDALYIDGASRPGGVERGCFRVGATRGFR